MFFSLPFMFKCSVGVFVVCKTLKFMTSDTLRVSRYCPQTHPSIPHNSHWSILYEIQAAHWWWSLNVQPYSPWRGPYQNPAVTEHSLRVLPNSLNSLHSWWSSRVSHSQVILKSLPHLKGPYQSPSEHTVSAHLKQGPYHHPSTSCTLCGHHCPLNERALPNPHRNHQNLPAERKNNLKGWRASLLTGVLTSQL